MSDVKSSDAGSSTERSNKPYKGTDSYQPEDAALFFGRDADATHLTSAILSTRITVLNAASGAGKTSLLNARIIPQLEARGWVPVRTHPGEGNDPIEAIRSGTLAALLPSPQAEVVVLDRAIRDLDVPPDPCLRDLLGAYDALPIADPRKRSLIAPIRTADSETGSLVPGFGRVVPYFSRVLRKSLEVQTFAGHLAAYLRPRTAPVVDALPLFNADAPVGELRRLLADPQAMAAYHALLGDLYIPLPSLTAFFQNLFATYGVSVPGVRLVLVLDQFEEIFTLFDDPGPAGVPRRVKSPRDWRMRPRLFQELEELYFAPASPAAPPGEGMPIRFVISLREEFVARLDPIRLFAPEMNNSTFRLSLLSAADAGDAIGQPARTFGYGYSQACSEQIIAQLTRKDGLVEPSHLQIVCEKLWKTSGALLSDSRARSQDLPAGDPPEAATIDTAALDALGGVIGILRSFFKEFLDSPSLTPFDRLELLDLLALLITSGRTRNIVEWEQLVNEPFRKSEQRERLLKRLIDARIVRLEPRLGGNFVEVTHEFLIGPILDAMPLEAVNNPRYAAGFALAVDYLSQARHSHLRTLPLEVFWNLDRNTDRVEWEPWAVGVMFRTAVEQIGDRAVLERWASLYRKSGAIEPAAVLLAAADLNGDRPFELEALRHIDAARETLTVSRSQIEWLVKGFISMGLPADVESVRFWTGRYVADESGPASSDR